METRLDRLLAARLYLVCDDPAPSLLEGALRGGVDLVQLRMKGASEHRILAVAERVARSCRRHGVLFLLNDRPELAARCNADGAHVGQDDIPVAEARELVGGDRLLGVSTHSPAQISAAASDAVDYIGVGPVYATPTKPGRAAVGIELVRHAAAHSRRPFFAIGGITLENLAAVRGAGAARVAVVRAITEAADPERAARSLRAEFERPHAESRQAPAGREALEAGVGTT